MSPLWIVYRIHQSSSENCISFSWRWFIIACQNAKSFSIWNCWPVRASIPMICAQGLSSHTAYLLDLSLVHSMHIKMHNEIQFCWSVQWEPRANTPEQETLPHLLYQSLVHSMHIKMHNGIQKHRCPLRAPCRACLHDQTVSYLFGPIAGSLYTSKCKMIFWLMRSSSGRLVSMFLIGIRLSYLCYRSPAQSMHVKMQDGFCFCWTFPWENDIPILDQAPLLSATGCRLTVRPSKGTMLSRLMRWSTESRSLLLSNSNIATYYS